MRSRLIILSVTKARKGQQPIAVLTTDCRLSTHALVADGCGAESARRGTHTPVRVSRRVRVPEHDLVEIDRLGLGAPVAINSEARPCVDEGRAVAAGAIVAIGHGALVGAAERAVEPHINAAADVMGGIEAHLHRGPALARQVAQADLRARHHRRQGAECAGGHLREETHALAEWARLDLEEGVGVAGRPVLEGILLDLVDDGAAGLSSRSRNVLRPIASDLKGEAVPHGLTEFYKVAGTGRAIGSDLDLRPFAGTTPSGSASTAPAREPSLLQM